MAKKEQMFEELITFARREASAVRGQYPRDAETWSLTNLIDRLADALTVASSPVEVDDARMNDLARAAHRTMVAESSDEEGIYYGFSHQRDAYEQGWRDGYVARMGAEPPAK